VNGLGFRDREIPDKQPERYRIAVVGDSIAWGQGLAAHERFSDRLGESLGARYEVFSGGGGAALAGELGVETILGAFLAGALLRMVDPDRQTGAHSLGGCRTSEWPILSNWSSAKCTMRT
jgi:hypothetical protein